MFVIIIQRLAVAMLGILVVSCGGGGGSPPRPPPPIIPAPVTIADPASFLAAARCQNALPAIFGGCAGVPTRASDPIRWRFADTSAHSEGPLPDGQISDAFASDNGTYFVQTYSYPPNGSFDAARNDGGDVAVVSGGTVRFSYTRPISPGAEGYWVGPGCPGGTGWLFFDDRAPTGSWRSAVAMLGASPTRGACPHLVPAYTQWRLETADVPFVAFNTPRTVRLPVVVSEHYAGTSIAAAGSMERYINARGVGRVLWQAWTRRTDIPEFPSRSALPWAGSPGAGWRLVDERLPTRLVSMPAAAFGWPASGFVP